ncbi:hypothetical protein C8R45DRAFT_1079512 [Mycena sanguinolenta]|nr:hypothetical protein C8R45DRAFT_1079512 [Mycena sanguinolenta]
MAISVRAILAEQTERTRQSSKVDIERFIQRSEEKIASLESQISTLVELRDRERAYVDALRHIMSPIRTLPIELLVEIFQLAIDDDTHIEDAHRISQICSGWRVIAHSTPRLWTRTIHVDLDNRDGREELYVASLKAWLARSAPLPLPVSLELVGEDPCQRILETVLSIAPRVQSLRCNKFSSSIFSPLARCRLDSLEELSLDIPGSFPTPPVFTMVPRLRKFSMTLLPTRTQVIVPWAQLTDITLDSNSPDLILDILAQCTHLMQVSICTSGWFSSTSSRLTRHPFALSQLHTLSLDVGYSQDIAHFLDALSAPALRSLCLNFMGMQDSMQSAAPLTAFLMQSPNITRLKILYGPCELASHQLIVALEHTPRLTHLALAYASGVYFNDALVDALTYKHGVAPLVPHLHNLLLHKIYQEGFETSALEHMFLSRWWSDADASQSHSHAVARWSRVGLSGDWCEPLLETLRRGRAEEKLELDASLFVELAFHPTTAKFEAQSHHENDFAGEKPRNGDFENIGRCPTCNRRNDASSMFVYHREAIIPARAASVKSAKTLSRTKWCRQGTRGATPSL